jgi:hypothetical protein
MSFKTSNIISGLFFFSLIIGAGFMQTQLKSSPQVFMLLFAIITLGSFFIKHQYKNSILFYILLGAMVYINIFNLTNYFVSTINPDNNIFVDYNGQKHQVMQMNWIWGVIVGCILSPLAIIFYDKKIQRNKLIEIIFTAVFIIMTAIIFIKYQLV